MMDKNPIVVLGPMIKPSESARRIWTRMLKAVKSSRADKTGQDLTQSSHAGYLGAIGND